MIGQQLVTEKSKSLMISFLWNSLYGKLMKSDEIIIGIRSKGTLTVITDYHRKFGQSLRHLAGRNCLRKNCVKAQPVFLGQE